MSLPVGDYLKHTQALSSGFQSIEFDYPSAGNYCGICWIKLDGKLLLDAGIRDLGQATALTLKSGSGVVSSVNVFNTMTLSSTNNEWVSGYYVSTPEKNAVEMRGYLTFDSLETMLIVALPSRGCVDERQEDANDHFPHYILDG